MDISLAKSLASHGAIAGFNVYNDRDGVINDWFFHVLPTGDRHPDDSGVPFSTARGQLKRYKSLDSLMRDVFAIIEADEARFSLPIHVHYS